MEMTNREIRLMYKYAKDPKKQIKILAQLNACSVQKIERILFGESRTKPSRKTNDIDIDAAIQMYANGRSVAEIAAIMGVSRDTIRRRLAAEGVITITSGNTVTGA